ncbi:hypothetical protein POM88_010391 [Heracleum sosnowskyi]|uniref:Uncharacterized protein n=1 Tax=Heracleum sosnowskyi TaxID=360622 RepID=A0AAD8MVQ0_9APIA|nr:hypothetical protein POM88_010391 [Heracleum sosnowskyi]
MGQSELLRPSNTETRVQREYNNVTDEVRNERNKRRKRPRPMKKETDEQRNARNQRRRERRAEKKETLLQNTSDSNVPRDSIQMIRRETFTTKAFAEVGTRTRNKINVIKLDFATGNSVLNTGLPDQECIHCEAIMWKYERTKQQQLTNSWGFSLCCSEGKVELPKLRETPPELKNLLDGSDQLRKLFCKYEDTKMDQKC